eukprot:scaffold104943_cov54-Attheya_sp.AAC.1
MTSVSSEISCIEEVEAQTYGSPLLARGGFGEVSIALHRGNNGSGTSEVVQLAAVKTIRNATVRNKSNSWQLRRHVFQELVALQHLTVWNKSDYVAPLLAAYPARDEGISPGSLSLAFPYCPIDLAEVLDQRRTSSHHLGFLDLSIVKTICRDILKAVQHCHDHNVLHRDIKPGNLLVSYDGCIQLCDFGLALPYHSPQDDSGGFCEDAEKKHVSPVEHALCTLRYRPPEVLFGLPSDGQTPAVDIWACGLVLAELLTLRPLFAGRNVLEQLNCIFSLLGSPNYQNNWPEVTHLPDYDKIDFAARAPIDWDTIVPHISESHALRSLLSHMVQLDPSKRGSAQELLETEDSWLGTCLPLGAPHSKVAQELLPNIYPPILFKGNSSSLSACKKRAVSIAKERRSIRNIHDKSMKHEQSGTVPSCIKSNGLLSALQMNRTNNNNIALG